MKNGRAGVPPDAADYRGRKARLSKESGIMNIANGKITFNADEIAKLRARLNDHKVATGQSWSQLAAETGVAQSTLAAWAADKYAGNNETVAADVYRFFEGLQARAEMLSVMPVAPDFILTPTATRFLGILRLAQMGDYVTIAGAPGVGKTTTLKYYRATHPNAWLSTMRPSTRGVGTMQVEVLKALGIRDAKGTPQMLSNRVLERIEGTGGLIMIDEAQHLSEQALEEIRGWHDATGIGVALIGNEEVITRLEGGNRAARFAQQYSRVGMRAMPKGVMPGDAEALIEAWGITDKAMVEFCLKVASNQGALRQMTKTIRAAMLAANGEQRPLSIGHLRDAWTQLSLRTAA